MTSRPMLFAGWKVRAILNGTATQTRRPIPPKFWEREVQRLRRLNPEVNAPWGRHHAAGLCPFGVTGDQLWAREAWAHNPDFPGSKVPACLLYRASEDGDDDTRWTPSIHMPRWASRLTLEITDVRVERVNQISDADALAEGVETHHVAGVKLYRLPGGEWKPSPSAAFKDGFRAMYPKLDPAAWVWALTFRRIAT